MGNLALSRLSLATILVGAALLASMISIELGIPLARRARSRRRHRNAGAEVDVEQVKRECLSTAIGAVSFAAPS